MKQKLERSEDSVRGQTLFYSVWTGCSPTMAGTSASGRKAQINVQVNATPKRNGKGRDTISATPARVFNGVSVDVISSTCPVPASTIKSRDLGLNTEEESSSTTPLALPLASTPVRVRSQPYFQIPDIDWLDKGSPSKLASSIARPERRSEKLHGKARLDFSLEQNDLSSVTQDVVARTPLKTREQPPAPKVPCTPASSSLQIDVTPETDMNENQRTGYHKRQADQAHHSKSIYETLGWDNDMDELLM